MRAHLSILFILSLIAAPVRAQWQTNGNSLNGGGGPQLVTDGSGGAIVGWGNWDPWGGQWAYAMGQHLSAGGNELWEPYGQIVCNSTRQYSPQLVSDGAGGGIFVWLDNRNGHLDIYAQRLNAAGAEQWTSCGVPVRVLPSDVGYNLAVVSDGSGGAIIAWSDPRASAGFDIYAQHVNLTGAMLWTANGVAVCTAAESQAPPVAVTDGSGGVWIAWDDARSGSNGDIYARHIAANGVPQGVANGLALCTAVDDQFRAAIAPDESGGVVVAWQDERTGTGDIYAQRVNSAGTSLWTTDGIAVCSQASHQESPDIASDGSGGAVVVWMDWRISPAGVSAYAQRVNSAGAIQWTADGNLLGSTVTPWAVDAAIIPDGGQSIVAWVATENNPSLDVVVRTQRLGADGAAQWVPGGVQLRRYSGNGGGNAEGPELVSDGWGGAIVAWTDWSYWQASAAYVAHVSPSGVATDVGPARGPSMRVANVYPNPFSGTASIAVELPASSKVEVDIFDVAGRKVRSFVDNDAALSKVIQIADRDADGRLLPSGVYFCRVRAAGETVTRKMVIAR